MNESLLVCISFHYNENRLKYLEQVVLNILSYNLNKTIVVETNQEFKLAIDNNNIIINTHRDLPHPFSLTWMHRQTILNKIDDYDYFMYIEDDMILPFDNFIEYLNNFNTLYNLDSVPSFIRLEEYNQKLFITDITTQQDNRPKLKINNKIFVNLSQPYHAFWILPQKELKESIRSDFFRLDTNRELAASYVMWELNKKPFVLMDGDKINKLSFSHHLPNNYSCDPKTKFGKIEINSLNIN